MVKLHSLSTAGINSILVKRQSGSVNEMYSFSSKYGYSFIEYVHKKYPKSDNIRLTLKVLILYSFNTRICRLTRNISLSVIISMFNEYLQLTTSPLI